MTSANLIKGDTVLYGPLTTEDIDVIVHGYCAQHVCSQAVAAAAVEARRRPDGQYGFTLYELLTYLGPLLPTDSRELTDSVLLAGLTADVPAEPSLLRVPTIVSSRYSETCVTDGCELANAAGTYG